MTSVIRQDRIVIMKRHKTRPIWVGQVKVGGGAPISVQSMTKTPPENIPATVKQIRELEELGCHLIRIAVPKMSVARVIPALKRRIHIPIEADIHFNANLALASIKYGVDAIRLNPGNIHDKEAVKEIVQAASKKRIPIRVGVNSGSVEGWFKHRPRGAKRKPRITWQAMVQCALEYCRYLESLKFRDIMVSLKGSDVISTVEAYRAMAKRTNYPLHLGVTAAGPLNSATVKSALGIGSLLLEGIGDTIRVSVTGPPHDEVRVAYEILGALGLAKRGPEIIACPTCGRCEIDVIKLTQEVTDKLSKLKNPTQLAGCKIAIMGCVVNGPGEAMEADIGIAGGRKFGWLFKQGRKVRKVRENQIVSELLREIRRF